jgi:molybdopterin-dependent oxidoreductase alpha subunit
MSENERIKPQVATDTAHDNANHHVQAEPPVETDGLKVTTPKEVAGGLPAVMSAMRHTLGEMKTVQAANALLHINQKGGYDCPSCAWPDPDGDRSFAEFCENGAKATADESMKARVTPEFFAQHSVAELSEKSDMWLGKAGRLTHPMVLRENASHYEKITWAEAFQLIAKELNALASPDEAIFYTSGRTSNEAAFLYQLFVRQYGTNNLPDCSNMCHESSGKALVPTIGVGKGTVKLDDFNKADAVFIIGQNPGTNHPRMLTALLEAKRHGVKVVNINPLPETGMKRFKHPQEVFSMVFGHGTQLCDLFLQIKINGDMAVLQGIMKEMIEEDEKQGGKVLDWAFIKENTEGIDALIASLKAVKWSDIIEQSGVSRDMIRKAADVMMASKKVIACWAMGLTQHTNAVETIQEVLNMLLMRGSIGKAGAGVCPVRGHSNVQGDRTMGIWETPKESFLVNLDKTFNFTSPRKHGYNTVESIKAMHEGKVKVFFALGGNFLSASPDTNFTAEAIRKCSLTVQVSTKLNRSHLVTGKVALILPCLGRTEHDMQPTGEQFISSENSMGVVQSSKGSLKPASEHLLSEPRIVAELAKATLENKSTVKWSELADNYDNIRSLIEKVIPGFENYNERVRKDGGFYLPNGPREGNFTTKTKKAVFTVHQFPNHKLETGQLVLMTMRSHDQFNTTIYGMDDRYRGIYNGRRVILMNPDDIQEMGYKQGDFVDITSHFNGEKRFAHKFAVVPFSIPRGNAASYFPETNVLVPIDSYDAVSFTPTSKYIIVTLAPALIEPTHTEHAAMTV